jgi:FKBP-type peptidyl-prolyl cis-trans isomerase
MSEKNKKLFGFLIVIAVVAILTFISVNSKKETSPVVTGNETTSNTNMQNKETTTPDGTKIIITKEGTGAEVKAGDTVAVNYTGKLANGSVFDSSVDPKFQHVQPFVLTVGVGQVIKGWDVGLVGMKVGEKRTLIIPAESAYGINGAKDGTKVIIPPNAVLTFDVELVAIKNK